MAVTPQRLHEFLSQDFGPDDWVVEGLLAAGSNTIIVAEEKAGKTYFAMALSLAVAAGVQFLAWPVQAPQRVLYVMTEGRPRMQWRRWHRLLKGMNLQSDALEIEILNVPYFYLNDGDGKTLHDLVRVLKPRLVVLDPLFHFVKGNVSSEDAAKAATDIITEAHFIAQAEGHDHAAVILHHTHRIRRDAWQGLPIDEQKERYFGSKVLAAWADSMIRLERYESGQGAVILDLDREEEEDAKRTYDIRLVREQEETVWRWELLLDQWGPATKVVLARLHEFEGKRSGEIAKIVGVSPQRMSEILKDLAKQRFIELEGGGRRGVALKLAKVLPSFKQ